jgi:hypothetical protein
MIHALAETRKRPLRAARSPPALRRPETRLHQSFVKVIKKRRISNLEFQSRFEMAVHLSSYARRDPLRAARSPPALRRPETRLHQSFVKVIKKWRISNLEIQSRFEMAVHHTLAETRKRPLRAARSPPALRRPETRLHQSFVKVIKRRRIWIWWTDLGSQK